MRSHLRLLAIATLLSSGSLRAQTAPVTPAATSSTTKVSAEEAMLAQFFGEALARGQAYRQLSALVAQYPGRLSGSKALEGAVIWAEETLQGFGLDRVAKQAVTVPRWERGEPEAVMMLTPTGAEMLSAVALGGSPATAKTGVIAEVIEVKSLDELVVLGSAKLTGKIVFFNRPMDPTPVNPHLAYRAAGDQRNRGPAAAAKLGAVGALTRSLTHALNDVPHTGATASNPDGPNIPSAALSTLAADKLSAALAGGATVRVTMKINAQKLPDAESHNVIGEIRGSEFPNEIILVGGHLDSWDIAPGAHDDGAGVVQSMEVLRLFKTLGVKPRHTLRCVLFTAEENGLAGALKYAEAAKAAGEKHIFAVETDSGGFQPRGFNLGSTQGTPHERAARWRPLFERYGISGFQAGPGGADVAPLMVQGCTVGNLAPDSQRYFDLHHTRLDGIEQVNPRELHIGAAALASLIWLVDTQGL
jgi:carboxypeptidase Q